MTSSVSASVQFSLDALKVSDKEAFEMLLSKLLRPGIPVDSFSHDVPLRENQFQVRSSVFVKVAESNANAALRPYQGSLKISYNSIGLNDIGVKYGKVVRAEIPTTTQEVMSHYFKANGLYDRSALFVNDPITQLGERTFFLKPESFLLATAFNFIVKPIQHLLADVVLVDHIPGFRTAADTQLPVKQVLSKQVEEANPTTVIHPFDTSLIDFTGPTSLNGAQFDNSSTTMGAIGDDGHYKGIKRVYYTRFNFAWYDNGRPIFMTGPAVPTTAYIVAQVAKLTGFNVVESDMRRVTLDAVPKGTVETITLPFLNSNQRYVGDITVDYKAV